MESPALFSFGMISDIQYADVDNRLNYTKTCVRHYRNALVLLREAIDHWTTDPPTGIRPDFIMQLGDVIDGCNNERGKKGSHRSLEVILGEFDRLQCTVHHLIGNHELYNFTREEIMNSRLFSGGDYETATRNSNCRCFPDGGSPVGLGSEAKSPSAYYHFSPFVGFRFVVLDSYSDSIIGHLESCPIREESLRRLRVVNKNELIDSPDGLIGSDRRFVAYNGGIGEIQMEWLRGLLQGACLTKEKVLIFVHTPIKPEGPPFSCLAWDYRDILHLVRSSPCVVAVLSGHTHQYTYELDDVSGVHFLTMPGIVEIQPGSNGFGTVQVHADKLILRGVGEVESREMPFPDKSLV